jgi:hypothetical protein
MADKKAQRGRRSEGNDRRASAIPGLQVALHDADVGSPGGVRWVGDAADDQLAEDIRDAIAGLVAEDHGPVTPPGTKEKLETCLLGHGGRSASLIWNSQCVAALVEMGFVPEAPCLEPHLDAIADRLVDSRIIDPLEIDYEDRDLREGHEPWVVRARHLAWVVACLSEFQPTNDSVEGAGGPPVDDGDAWLPSSGRPTNVAPGSKSKWNEWRYRRLLRHAYDGLVGSHITGPKPAAWVSPRRDDFELIWHEVIRERDPSRSEAYGRPVRRVNALTTFYSVLAICRAERHHHTRYSDAWHALAHDEQTPSALVDHLLTQIHVQPAPDGPIVRLLPQRAHDEEGASSWEWSETWIREATTLPHSVIALLALTLVEYTRFLTPLVPPEVLPRISGAFLKAHRLGQALLARPASDNDVLWSRGVDAFFLYGEDDAWFTPSYSLCLRAVLETGAAIPSHPLVRDALETIERLRTEDEHSWIDATYHTGLDVEAKLQRKHTRYTTHGSETLTEPQAPPVQHVSLDVDVFATNWKPAQNVEWQPRAPSIHAAALAYSSLRRARSRVDPRIAVERPEPPARSRVRSPAKKLSPCPFTLLEITPRGDGDFNAHLSRRDPVGGRSDALYYESAVIDQRVVDLLTSVPSGGIPVGELMKALPARSRPTAKRRDREDPRDVALAEVNALRTAIDRLNVFFGCQMIRVAKDPGSPSQDATLAPGLTVRM